MEGKAYHVNVVGLRGNKAVIKMANTEQQFKSMTVKQLKEKMAHTFPEIDGKENFRLIFTDEDLDEDSKLLCEYGVQDKSFIVMIMKLPGGLTE